MEYLPQPLEAEHKVYEHFRGRIESNYPGFDVKEFEDILEVFLPTYLPPTELHSSEWIDALTEQLTTPESFRQLRADLATHWDRYRLADELRGKSIVVLTNHRRFTDLPLICAAITQNLRAEVADIALRNHIIVGKMIPLMTLDLFGDGQPLDVSEQLRGFTGLIQSVPGRLQPKDKAVNALREQWNKDAKLHIDNRCNEKGNIIYVAASGTHDKPSRDGRQLVMQKLNSETARLLARKDVVVLPIFFSCDPFTNQGLIPTPMMYELLPPLSFINKDQVHEYMGYLAQMGTRLLKTEFPDGVVYQSGVESRLESARDWARKIR